MHLPLILLIDGNNLAHFLYTNLVPGQKMTAALSQRLIAHLDSYARTYPQDVQVELCLDRFPGDFDLPAENLLVLPAEYPQTGDDLLLDRFWYHQYSGQTCLVITNDEAILDEVGQAGGATLRVYDFVRRPGLTTPVFRAPEELPAVVGPLLPPVELSRRSLSASIYFRLVEKQRPARETVQPSAQCIPAQPAITPPQAARRPEAPHTITNAAAAAGTAAAAGSAEEPSDPLPEYETAGEGSPAAGEVAPVDENGPYYFLSLENWPIGEGIRLLLNAFCPLHREEYKDLIAALDPDRQSPADLRALAELLLQACGDEPDFARRGALMTRVRLALLQARGEPLNLVQMAERTGLKLPGLQGRIKAKAGHWVEILML